MPFLFLKERIAEYEKILSMLDFRQWQGLNEFELQAISIAKQGDCLFTIGSNNRSFLHIKASETKASARMKDKNMNNKPENKLLNGYKTHIESEHEKVSN
ncbi:hypothetical protein [Spiroplasma endosymbiont of Virgichneumon dumeticola]|uniref:hypothetical protein n=1 Tax=Spiroplasma endosymbiont of Virgichneumon dumeticola TaxID=3139323 RepID=UPI0035C87FA0